MPAIRPISLTFDALADRLVRQLATLIHAGAATERSLAMRAGISQTHLHNVLNGTRKMTSTMADRAMELLDWSLLDLLDTNEALHLLDRREAAQTRGRDVLLTRLGVGRGCHFPGAAGGAMLIPNNWLARTENPLAVSAGEDEEMDGVIAAGDVLLVDDAPEARMRIHEDTLYAVRLEGFCVARWVRFSSRGLYLVAADNWTEPSRWTLTVIASSRRTEMILGKIIALARPPGCKFRRPVLPFCSS